jgi:nicotinamide-nucleotide amidase
VATTGEAGPESASGQPVGTVHVAVVGPGVDRVRALRLAGDRAAVRAASVTAALELLADALPGGPNG